MEEITQQRYGQDAEGPRTPYGSLTSALGPPVMPIEGRIAQLCKQVTEASQQLAMTRAKFAEARGQREHAEGMFAKVVEDLLQAINEHREGMPENVPYSR